MGSILCHRFYSGCKIAILSFAQTGIENESVCLESHICTVLPLGHVSNARSLLKSNYGALNKQNAKSDF